MTDEQIILRDLVPILPSFNEQKRGLIEERCIQLLEQLSSWWRDFEFESSSVNFEVIQKSLQPPQFLPTTFVFADTFTAFIVSVYDAASLILHFTLHGISSLPFTSHLAQATSHAESILLISKFQQESNPVGFDLIRNTFALKVVENMGPGEQLRERAARVSLRWEEFGLAGILAADLGKPPTGHRSYQREYLLASL